MAESESFRPSDPLAGARAAPGAAENGFPPTPEKGLYAYVPGLWVLRNYRKAWLWDDLVAGLVVSSVLVPAGMGYAVAAGLPPITGLYATIVPLLAYAVFGPSRIMVLGPDSGLAALIAATVVAVPASATVPSFDNVFGSISTRGSLFRPSATYSTA